jgi:hypothetical protein
MVRIGRQYLCAASATRHYNRFSEQRQMTPLTALRLRENTVFLRNHEVVEPTSFPAPLPVRISSSLQQTAASAVADLHSEKIDEYAGGHSPVSLRTYATVYAFRCSVMDRTLKRMLSGSTKKRSPRGRSLGEASLVNVLHETTQTKRQFQDYPLWGRTVAHHRETVHRIDSSSGSRLRVAAGCR